MTKRACFVRLMPFALALVFLIAQISTSSALVAPNKPKFVLVIVIDQFRADYLTRFEKKFLPPTKSGDVGGFRFLMENGAYYPWATYDILQSMTGPGHATVLTGSYPYQTGIPVNDWYDVIRNQPVYCVEDTSLPTVGAQPNDPHIGTSPRKLMGSTFGDELKNDDRQARVFSVSIKDRAAILLGGHRADLALWLDHSSFQWVSSRFYLPSGELPKWLTAYNQELTKIKGTPYDWSESTDDAGSFTHNAKKGSYESLCYPFGVELTGSIAEKLINEYDLGHGASTDVLAMSFSSHDYLGHEYGPNSPELEALTLAEDRTISSVLNTIRKRMPHGLDDVTIALTADHGTPNEPEFMNARGFDSGHISEKKVGDEIEKFLSAKFGKPAGAASYIAHFESLNMFFNRAVLEQKKLSLETVEALVKTELMKNPAINHVVTSSEYDQAKLPPGVFARQIQHTYFKGHSGDIIAIPKPFYFSGEHSVTHMTGYNFDRTVPLILFGRPFKSGRYANEAAVIDLAPTLSFITNVMPPALSEGRVLNEALKKNPEPAD